MNPDGRNARSFEVDDNVHNQDEGELLLDSAALARLIEEIRIEGTSVGQHYNRTYNRHNR